jgi:hypothetical protein
MQFLMLIKLNQQKIMGVDIFKQIVLITDRFLTIPQIDDMNE